MTLINITKRDAQDKASKSENDKLRRFIEKGDHIEEFSPMAPPDEYDPPCGGLNIEYQDLHPMLQALVDDHEEIRKELGDFEAALTKIRTDGPSDAVNDDLNHFFEFLNTVVFNHNRLEEKTLFPLLGERMLESGEHSIGAKPITAADVLTNEHLDFLQLAAVMTNFFRLAPCLPEENSRYYVLDAAIRQALELIKQLKLHMFREDKVVFPLAHQLITQEEFDAIHQKNSLNGKTGGGVEVSDT